MIMRAAPRTVHREERPGRVPGRVSSRTDQRRGTPVSSEAEVRRSIDEAFQAPLKLLPRITAARLWEAWQALDRWEAAADDELGDTLGELLLVLWSVHRLGLSSEGQAALGELIDDEMHPTFGDALLQDVVGVSFALGAAWAEQRQSGSAGAPAPVVPIR